MKKDEFTPIADVLKGLTCRKKGGQALCSTDPILRELEGGKFAVIAGRPAMGKTALALQIAADFAERSGKEVLVFSASDAADVCVKRILSQVSGIDGYRIENDCLTGAEQNAIDAAIERIGKMKITFVCTPELSARDICEKLEAVPDAGMVIVDPADAVFGESDGSAETELLRSAARRAGIPVICCCKIPRAVEGRVDKRPKVPDLFPKCLRDADVAVFPYRESYYDPSAPDRTAEIRVAVNGGDSYVLKAGFDPSAVLFYCLRRGKSRIDS